MGRLPFELSKLPRRGQDRPLNGFGTEWGQLQRLLLRARPIQDRLDHLVEALQRCILLLHP